jgi:hypothetical protein
MTPNTMRRAYLREAAFTLFVARLALWLIPLARIFAWMNRPLRRIRRFATDEARWIAWSVETIGARPWMNALCLPRAVAAQAMLRRRGIASRLCLGVACDEDALAAHAWVEVGHEVVVGGADAARFTEMTRFGAPAQS